MIMLFETKHSAQISACLLLVLLKSCMNPVAYHVKWFYVDVGNTMLKSQTVCLLLWMLAAVLSVQKIYIDLCLSCLFVASRLLHCVAWTYCVPCLLSHVDWIPCLWCWVESCCCMKPNPKCCMNLCLCLVCCQLMLYDDWFYLNKLVPMSCLLTMLLKFQLMMNTCCCYYLWVHEHCCYTMLLIMLLKPCCHFKNPVVF
jgi:hypothetical protein